MDRPRAHADGVRLLAARELSVEGLRARLHARGHTPEETETAIALLLESGALDDRRVARAYARTAVTVKGRGRLRIRRELLQMGVDSEVAAEAVGDVFGELDERSLVDNAIRKKLRGRPGPLDVREQARLYQYLMRQGFPPAVVAGALRKLRGARQPDQD